MKAFCEYNDFEIAGEYEDAGKSGKAIEGRAAFFDMTDAIYNVLHTTIKTIYPKYYPREVVDFFCQHHSKEPICDGIASENMEVLMNGNVIVGK